MNGRVRRLKRVRARVCACSRGRASAHQSASRGRHVDDASGAHRSGGLSNPEAPGLPKRQPQSSTHWPAGAVRASASGASQAPQLSIIWGRFAEFGPSLREALADLNTAH